MITAKEARAISDPIKQKLMLEAATSYYSSIDNMIKCEANRGRSKVEVEANSFKEHRGEEHYSALGYTVRFINNGGWNDPDAYSIEW